MMGEFGAPLEDGFEDRFRVEGELPDGGTVVRDLRRGTTHEVCPFNKPGDCISDPMDAMDCSLDYHTCPKYKSRTHGENK